MPVPVPDDPNGAATKASTSTDVLIVGAGLSGLACARRLVAAGLAVEVVEAQDRVGGRALTVTLAGAEVDLGGQWLSAGQPRLAALVAELGISTIPERRDGEAIVDVPGAARRWPGRLWSALALARRARAIEKMAARAASGAPDTAAWDARSLGAWLDAEVRDAGARAAIELHAALTFAAAPEDLSLLHYLATLGATGGFGRGGDELPGGGREHRLAGGAGGLCRRLADELGDRVTLSWPVTSIAAEGGVEVAGPGGVRRARRAVLAIPPSLARPIAIDPPLPAAAARLAAASRPGRVVKVAVAYARPFWRDAGLSGEAYAARGPVRAVVDASGPGGAPPILLAFVVGAEAARWAAADEPARRAAVVGALVELFGPDAGAPVDLVARDWGADPWTGGCVAGLPPGAGTPAAWRGPWGPIHVAGTEAATAWPGYLEGALDAAARAAGEVIASLRARVAPTR